VLGGGYFLGVRLRRRHVAGEGASFHLAPIVLLLSVAGTGLALPATRDLRTAFAIASVAHQASVVALLVALSTSKLAHVLVRPLPLGARVVRADGERRLSCSECGGPLAPVAQQAAVEALLTERGFRFAAHQRHCPACRRRKLAGAQARLLDAHFQPTLAG